MRKAIATTAFAIVGTLGLIACGTSGAPGADGEGLPSQIVWSTYGTGTSTYADAAAVANAITTNQGTRIRIITSDTAIGRLTPVRNGQAQMSRTGDDYIYAFEGDHDFATKEWGPQDVRVVWPAPLDTGLLVRDDSGIQNVEDLRGKRFPRTTANPSVNNKLEAYLAYGGLTWDDVQVVEMGYGEQPDALKAGKIDVLFHAVYGAALYELESAFPVRWLSIDDDSVAKVEAIEDTAPSVEIGVFDEAPGQEKGETAVGLRYAVPVVAWAEADQTLVYETVKAIHGNFDSYKDATANTPAWSLENIQTEPRQVPFHPGLVRFLEENDAWSAEAEARNNQLIKRGEALRAGWNGFIEDAGDGNVGKAWTAWKDKNVPAE
ncbi:TAXI family TRAP transporter solute-binding subunit [Amycolatopsis palatopharyngis]|uniref:TAXI family TRAP transporter solute-binding subunit n=1 Tax=Amycolatopsis palatopharyngis TaxID=187982 RepID=UPI000E22B76F|nr:TAXI family TRAP transporter solute-binding subunit [Amycolatopsis palatopharyngis]